VTAAVAGNLGVTIAGVAGNARHSDREDRWVGRDYHQACRARLPPD
jgi:hypothetical protein